MTADVDTSRWPMHPGPAHPFRAGDDDRCGYGAASVPCRRLADDVTHRQPWCAACGQHHWSPWYGHAS